MTSQEYNKMIEDFGLWFKTKREQERARRSAKRKRGTKPYRLVLLLPQKIRPAMGKPYYSDEKMSMKLLGDYYNLTRLHSRVSKIRAGWKQDTLVKACIIFKNSGKTVTYGPSQRPALP